MAFDATHEDENFGVEKYFVNNGMVTGASARLYFENASSKTPYSEIQRRQLVEQQMQQAENLGRKFEKAQQSTALETQGSATPDRKQQRQQQQQQAGGLIHTSDEAKRRQRQEQERQAQANQRKLAA